MSALLTLEQAAESLHKTVTVSALRKAVRNGKLPRRKLGRRYYLYPGDLEVLLCPDENQPGSTTEETKANGSSETVPDRSGQAMAMASLSKLKKHSESTSPIKDHPPATVQPIRET